MNKTWKTILQVISYIIAAILGAAGEAEDAGDKQEGLGHIDQQTVGHVVDPDDLISHQCNAAHDEQHRTGVLRDFETIFTFHSS